MSLSFFEDKLIYFLSKILKIAQNPQAVGATEASTTFSMTSGRL